MPTTVMEQYLNSKRSDESSAVSSEEVQSIYNSMNLRSSKITNVTANTMTQIYRVLARFRLNKNEIKAYILLARAGPQKAQNISERISIERTEVYKTLKTLEGLGLITKTLDKPMRFKAKPFEMVLEGLIKEKRKRIYELEEQKSRILDVWNALPKLSEEDVSEGIQVLEGKRQIITKIDEMLSNCKNDLQIVVKDKELIWLYNSMFFEDANKLGNQRDLNLKLLTNYSDVSEYVFDKVDTCVDHAFMKRVSEPSFVLKDDFELMVIMKDGEKGPMAMHTNYPAVIRAFKALFGYIWVETCQGQAIRGVKR